MAFARWLVLSGLAVVAILVVGTGGRGPVDGSDVASPPWAHVAPEQIAEARKYGVPVAFENWIGMRFVLVPAGTFTMGSPATEEDRRDDEVEHEVVLTKAFYVGVTEVTNGEYRKWKADHDSGSFMDQSLNGDRQPVVDVTWHDAKAYAQWLTDWDGTRRYDLPTEAQWEYACRAGTRTRFWWGDAETEGWRCANAYDPKTEEAFGFGWEVWPKDDGYRVTAPVGSYAASPWGLYDMLGNVWEWCGDWHGDHPAGKATDPSGPLEGRFRVMRGGSWYASPRYVRSADRRKSVPVNRRGFIGFRLVSPLPPPR